MNRSNEYYLDASGKGINVSRVLVQLGDKVVHLTQAGGQNKDLFLSMAEKDNIRYDWVESHAEIRFCYTLLNQEKHTTTEIIEEAKPVGRETEKHIYNRFQALLPDCHTVIISGTKAPGFSAGLYPNMVKDAKTLGKNIILDLKGDDLLNSLSFQPDIVKPNLSEFTDTFFKGLSVGEHEVREEVFHRVKDKMLEIYDQYRTISILTRGKYGAVYVERGKLTASDAETIEPVNTIGCGDAFTAGLAWAWHQERDIEKAVKKGMDCARRNALLVRPGVIR